MLQLSIRRARSAMLTLVVGTVMGGCGQGENQGSLEPPPPPPPPPPTYTALMLQPERAQLGLEAPRNTVRLDALAFAQDGETMSYSTAPAFSSSSPAIATVSDTGVVTAVAPGEAKITATLTVGGVTRTASMVATVHPPDTEAVDLSGVYALTARGMHEDPLMSTPDGTVQTAILTLVQAPGTSALTGTFTEFKSASSSDPGDPDDPGISGTVGGYVNPYGWVVIDLVPQRGQTAIWHGEGLLDSGRVVGSYGCCGHSGSFIAERQPEPAEASAR
jgi:hypothetical protein